LSTANISRANSAYHGFSTKSGIVHVAFQIYGPTPFARDYQNTEAHCLPADAIAAAHVGLIRFAAANIFIELFSRWL